MRVVINEAQISRNRRISHVLFFVSLAGMAVGFYFTWTSDPSSGASSQISCLILPMLLFMTLTSVRMANTWIREPRPVNVISESLKGFGQKYAVFHYLLPAPHVLVGPEGVFTLTTIWQDRQYRVKGAKWHGDEGLLRKINGYMRQDLVGNPFQEAQFHAQQVQRLVDKIAPDRGVEVQPLIVLIHPNVNVEIEDPALPVLYADTKRKPALRHYLRNQKDAGLATLTPEDLDKLDAMYGLVTRQELAEMSGVDLSTDEDVDMVEDDAPDAELMVEGDAEEGDIGTVFVVLGGQLYYIGATNKALEEEVSRLQSESEQELKIIHSFEAEDPEAIVAYLRKKYARKRQKEEWFGLSKKDVAWLKSRKGELS